MSFNDTFNEIFKEQIQKNQISFAAGKAFLEKLQIPQILESIVLILRPEGHPTPAEYFVKNMEMTALLMESDRKRTKLRSMNWSYKREYEYEWEISSNNSLVADNCQGKYYNISIKNLSHHGVRVFSVLADDKDIYYIFGEEIQKSYAQSDLAELSKDDVFGQIIRFLFDCFNHF